MRGEEEVQRRESPLSSPPLTTGLVDEMDKERVEDRGGLRGWMVLNQEGQAE